MFMLVQEERLLEMVPVAYNTNDASLVEAQNQLASLGTEDDENRDALAAATKRIADRKAVLLAEARKEAGRLRDVRLLGAVHKIRGWPEAK